VRDRRMQRLPMLMLIVLLVACRGDEPAPDASMSADSASDSTATAAAGGTPAPPQESPEARRQRLIDAARPEVPDWEPQVPAADAQSIDERLQTARAAFDAGRIERGEDNALGTYLGILRDDPAHAEALAGVEQIVVLVLQRVEQALLDRRLADATADIAILRRLRAGDTRLVALEERVQRAHEIQALLEEADRLALAGNALEPRDSSAAALYAAVLERDPVNADAADGLARLEADLVAQATAAAEAGDYARSDRLLADAARVRPGSGPVQDASTQIVELRQGRAGELMQQAGEALLRRDVARAEQLLAQLERVSAQAQGLEELRGRIEQARLYGGFAPGLSLREPLASGGAAPELVVVPIGRFEMGSPSGEADRKKNEGPQHEVVVSRGFAIARSEVTVADFGRFVAATGYQTSAQAAGRSMIYDERTGTMAERRNVDWQRDHAGRRAEPDLPVVHVSWLDARAYADWLTRETGATYRLPSEAEFEYVIRAGGTTRYPWGDAVPTRPVANVTGEKDRSESSREWTNAFAGYGDGFWGAAPVRAYRANAFGVHDIDGNVSEWVEDCWHDNYARAPSDTSAWVNPGCKSRVVRGASWASSPDQARSAFRLKAKPESSNARVGFRVARDL
jgi:formylglycine-generating enzyme required for sulfatase activity